MPSIPSCSAIVLAGGRATRLDGVDKALLPLAGRPLLAHVLARLQPQVDDIVINYNRDPALLADFGHLVVADATTDFPGPLAGIAAALPHCRHELVLVAPCDAPFLPIDLQSQLAAALAPGIDLVMAHDGMRLQPLFLLLRRTLLESLQASLATSERKVERWCLAQKSTTVRFDDRRAFSNLNAPQDLQAAEKSVREGDTPLSGTENGA